MRVHEAPPPAQQDLLMLPPPTAPAVVRPGQLVADIQRGLALEMVKERLSHLASVDECLEYIGILDGGETKGLEQLASQGAMARGIEQMSGQQRRLAIQELHLKPRSSKPGVLAQVQRAITVAVAFAGRVFSAAR